MKSKYIIFCISNVTGELYPAHSYRPFDTLAEAETALKESLTRSPSIETEYVIGQFTPIVKMYRPKTEIVEEMVKGDY